MDRNYNSGEGNLEGASNGPAGFESAKRMAREFAKDRDKTGHLLDEAMSKAERHQKMLNSIWFDLQALIRMLRAWRRGDYPMPWQTVVFAIAAIVYFVNPFDFIPDFIPISGFLDDATVIGFVLRSIKRDIDEFLQWQEGVTEDIPEATRESGDGASE